MSRRIVNNGADGSGYNTAKAGVIQLACDLASEWGAREDMPLIRVNTVSPDYVRTQQTVEGLSLPGVEERRNSQNMLNRLAYPDEARGPILFLLSDVSSYRTAVDSRIHGRHSAW